MRHLHRCAGVFTTDPRYVKTARKLAGISYDEMLELANLGAGVLHPRAVEFAKNYQVPLKSVQAPKRSRHINRGGIINGTEFNRKRHCI